MRKWTCQFWQNLFQWHLHPAWNNSCHTKFMECKKCPWYNERRLMPLMTVLTVCFFSNATLHDGITLKVIEIIEFWKKFLKDSVDAFYDMWLPGFFHKNLVLGTSKEVDVIISKLFLYKNLSFGLFPFKLLSFLNELSYRYQIGPKWKVFWSSFWDSLSWNAHFLFQIDLWTVNQLLIKIFVKTPIFFMLYVIHYWRKISLFAFLKATSN